MINKIKNHVHMKISNRTLIMLILLIGFIAALSACKKSTDSDPEPTPNPPPWDTTKPIVFHDNKLLLRTPYEIQNNLLFPSAVIQSIFTGSVHTKQSQLEIMSVFETLNKVFDYFQHKQEMAELNSKLNEIQNELGQIQSELEALALQMQISTQEIINQISVNALQPSVTAVQNAYSDSGTINGLKYYSYNGIRYQKGLITDADMQILVVGPNPQNPYTKQYSDNIIASGSMTNALTQFNSYLMGTTTISSILDGFTHWVMLKNSGAYTDTSRFIKGYELIENYFQYYLNYEFMAATVQQNADNYRDSTGVLANAFMLNSFVPLIRQQLDKFLSVVDYYVINAYDYRYASQYNYDMSYNLAGLAPDPVAMKILSRARFLANTYLIAISQPYPTYCGSIILPMYNNMEKATVPAFDITMGGVVLARPRTVNLPSQIPYTYWLSNGNDYTLKYGADYNWVIYHYEQMEDAGHTYTCSPQAVKIVDNGSTSYPWFHMSPIQGTVTPLYFNPLNPGQTSASKTSSCTMKFSFLAGAWRWGFMKLYFTDRNSTQLFIPDPQQVQNYQYKQLTEWDWAYLCNWGLTISQWHSFTGKYDDYTDNYKSGFVTDQGKSMKLNFRKPFDKTGNTWVVNGMNGFTVSADGNPPAMNSFTKYWMYSELGVNEQYSFGFIVAQGFSDATGGNNNCNGTMWALSYPDNANHLVQKTMVGPSTGSYSGVEVHPVSGQNPLLYWYWTNHNPANSYSMNVSLDINLQYVPSGYGNLP